MRQLLELVERCVSTFAAARSEYLSASVRLHTELLSVRRLASPAGQSREIPLSAHFAHLVEQAASLVEKAALRKTDDDNAAIADVERKIQELLKSFYGGSTTAPAPTAAAEQNMGNGDSQCFNETFRRSWRPRWC